MIRLVFLFIFIPGISFSQKNISEFLKSFPDTEFPHVDTLLVKPERNSLNLKVWDSAGFDGIEDFDEKSGKYALIAAFPKKENYRCIIIARVSENEEIHWLVTIDNENKLIDYRETAYENSEGATTQYSEIKSGYVKVSSLNMFTSDKYFHKTYKTDENGKFKLQVN